MKTHLKYNFMGVAKAERQRMRAEMLFTLSFFMFKNIIERYIGVWGQRHLRYIRQHRKVLYSTLLTSGKINTYLADVEEQAQELFDCLIKKRAKH